MFTPTNKGTTTTCSTTHVNNGQACIAVWFLRYHYTTEELKKTISQLNLSLNTLFSLPYIRQTKNPIYMKASLPGHF